MVRRQCQRAILGVCGWFGWNNHWNTRVGSVDLITPAYFKL